MDSGVSGRYLASKGSGFPSATTLRSIMSQSENPPQIDKSTSAGRANFGEQSESYVIKVRKEHDQSSLIEWTNPLRSRRSR